MRQTNPMPIIAAACFALAGCASTADPKLAVCDGKHRRPANPNGSVLTIAPTGSAAPSPVPQSKAPPPVATPGPRAAVDPRSTRPCGDQA
jgi:hypothetical protein